MYPSWVVVMTLHLLLRMWCVVCVFLLSFILTGLVYKLARSKPDGVPTAWGCYYIPLLSPGIPNYLLSDALAKIHGSFAVLKTPITKGVTVNVTELDMAKRLMKSSDWVSRFPDDHFFYETSFNKPLGVLLGNGEYWKQSRKFMLRLFHQCGFYSAQNIQNVIHSELLDVEKRLVNLIASADGGISVDLCPHRFFQIHTLNIVTQVLMGYTLDREQPEVQDFLDRVTNPDFNLGASLVDIFPWLRYIPGMTYMSTFKESSDACYEHFAKVIEERRQKGNYHLQPEDLLDHLLQAVDSHRGDCPNYFTEEALLANLRDLVFAGSDTTTSVLEFGIMYMVLNEDVQVKVRKEIDTVLGRTSVPTYADRERMPYTQAVIQEILRCATPIPMSARSSVKDNEIGGRVIPKDSFVAINLYSIHMSDQLWEDPHVFRPERFLNANNEIVNTGNVIPFGFGKRACIGESSARHTMFIFFVALLQKFTLSLSDNYPTPSLENGMGMTRYPAPYFFKLTKRMEP